MGCYTTSARVYNGRDNIISLVLLDDGVVLTDLSPVTRATVEVAGVLIDSATAGADVIWWSQQAEYEGQMIDVLRLRLGEQGIPAGVYNDVDVVIYDSVYIQGLRVQTPVEFTVI